MGTLNLPTDSGRPFSQVFEEELFKKFRREIKLTGYRKMAPSH